MRTCGGSGAADPGGKCQRDLVWALAATAPETAAFTKAWVAAQPDNPTALTARAWSLYWAAAKIRGERIRRWTRTATVWC